MVMQKKTLTAFLLAVNADTAKHGSLYISYIYQYASISICFNIKINMLIMLELLIYNVPHHTLLFYMEETLLWTETFALMVLLHTVFLYERSGSCSLCTKPPQLHHYSLSDCCTREEDKGQFFKAQLKLLIIATKSLGESYCLHKQKQQ